MARSLTRKVRGERDESGDRIFDLINGHSHIDMLDFPELTKAYLGLCPQPFDELLQSTPRVSIDLADSIGRTTLYWASHAGNWETMEKLIRCGADPNKADAWGITPLHLSAYGDSKCLKLLLCAKADVDLKNIHGLTVMHGLSANGWDTTSLDLLLIYGANIEGTNRIGQTPLQSAIVQDNHLMVSGLLERGANINARDTYEWTCLFRALYHRSHNSLRVLLDNTGLRYNMKFDNGWTLLHVAAIFADIESLCILMLKPLYELDTAEEDVHGWTAMGIAKYRMLNNERWPRHFGRPQDNDPTEWYDVFEELLESIIDAQASIAGSIDDEASEEDMADSEHSCGLSDETCENNEDEDELWEDAQEDLDGQSQG